MALVSPGVHGKRQINAIAVVPARQTETEIDSADDAISDGVDSRIIGWFVAAFGPSIGRVIEIDVRPA